MTDEVMPEEAGQPETQGSEPTPEQVETAEATTAEAQPVEPERKSGAEKRISQLVYEREEAKREVKRLQEQLSQPEGDAPRENDFENYDDYVAAKAVHAMEQRQREQQQQQLQARQQALIAERQQQFQAQVIEAKGKYADFEQVAFNPQVPITEGVAQLLTTTDKGADIAYHLGKNPEVAQRLAQMDPLQAAIEIGKIEANLKLPQPKTVTDAPEPLAPVGGGGDAGAADPSNMTTEQFIEWRYQQLNSK